MPHLLSESHTMRVVAFLLKTVGTRKLSLPVWWPDMWPASKKLRQQQFHLSGPVTVQEKLSEIRP